MTTVRYDPVEAAIQAVAAGQAVLVADDESRENEGDLVFAAEAATHELVAFTVRYSSGLLCAPTDGSRLDQLGIPPMTSVNAEAMGTAFTVSVDAATGITTGISAADRAHTLRVLADPESDRTALVQPGHLFPLRARPAGVLERPGHTEAAVDLMRLAGRQTVGVIAELVHDDGTMRRGQDLREFADEHGIVVTSIADLIRYRRQHEELVTRLTATRIPTRFGEFTAHAYRSWPDGHEHVALVHGQPDTVATPLVRLHSECLTGDALGSLRCDCGPQLDAALESVVAAGHGVVVYVRGHEGRGIGLAAKLRAYTLQDDGLDTVEANLALGLPADNRDYAVAAGMLSDLGVDNVRLLTNNPAKRAGLEEYGIGVHTSVGLVIRPTRENARYLTAKRRRLGHLLPSAMTNDVEAAG